MKKLQDQDVKFLENSREFLTFQNLFLTYFVLGSAPSSNGNFFDQTWCQISLFFSRENGLNFFPFTLFEKWKWNKIDWKLRLRSESVIKMTRDWKVKFPKKKSWESRLSLVTEVCITHSVTISRRTDVKVLMKKETWRKNWRNRPWIKRQRSTRFEVSSTGSATCSTGN